jgi:hypothetical protein
MKVFGSLKAAAEWSVTSIFNFLVKLYKAISAFLREFNDQSTTNPAPPTTIVPPFILENIIKIIIDRVFRATNEEGVRGAAYKAALKAELVYDKELRDEIMGFFAKCGSCGQLVLLVTDKETHGDSNDQG